MHSISLGDVRSLLVFPHESVNSSAKTTGLKTRKRHNLPVSDVRSRFDVSSEVRLTSFTEPKKCKSCGRKDDGIYERITRSIKLTYS